MKKTTLAMSALALSLGLALSPLSATAAETSSSAMTAQQMPSLAPMLEKVMPSVVSINVEGIIHRSARTDLRSRVHRSARAAHRALVTAAASSRNLWRWVPA